jgi:AraC-like DNA-binding protein
MNFTIFGNITQLTAGIIGLVTVFIILFSLKSNKMINLFLVFLIINASIRMLTRSTFSLNIQHSFDDYSGPYKSILLFVVPLFYLYFKAIVFDNSKILKRDFIHFVFPLVFFIFNLICFKFQLIEINQLRLFNLIICSFISLLYLYYSILMLRTKLWNQELEIHKGHYKLIKNWTIFLAIICVILTFRLVVSLLYEWLKGSDLTGHSMAIIQVTLWLIIFLKILISPEILFGLPKLRRKASTFSVSEITFSNFWKMGTFEFTNEQDKKLKNKVDPRILILIEEIEYLIQNMNYFRNQKITLINLASELNIPTSHIVCLFKYRCDMTFTEYKSVIRIKDAQRLIESGFLGTNTLESLAIKVGFSSYNPFFTAFKKLIGNTPNDYSINSMAKSKQSLI